MSGSTLNVTPGSGQPVQGSVSSSSNFLQSIGIEDKDSGVVQSIFDAGTGQHAGIISGGYKELSGLTAGSLNADLLPSTDVSNYASISFATTGGTFVGSLSIQESNDNTNWRAKSFWDSNSLVAGGVSVTSSTSIVLSGSKTARYLRIRMTSYTSGATSGVVELYTQSSIPSGLPVTAGSSSSTSGTIPTTAFYVGMVDGGNTLKGMSRVDAVSDANTAGLLTGPELFNGTNWDKQRNNEDVSLLASAARTTTQTSADLVNYNGKSGLLVYLNVTSAGTGSITVSIQRKDPASAGYTTVLTGAVVTANTSSPTIYSVGPDILDVANVSAQAYLGRTFRIVVTANNANSVTYSVGYSLVRG